MTKPKINASHKMIRRILSSVYGAGYNLLDTLPVTKVRDFFEKRSHAHRKEQNNFYGTVMQLPLPKDLRYEGAFTKIFFPEDCRTTALYPLIIYIPGGGFVTKNIKKSTFLCQYLSSQLECAVAYIQYPLSPENKFPVPHKFALEVCEQIINMHRELNINKNLIIMWGDSSGGNLVASITTTLDHMFAAQILNCPSLDYINVYNSKLEYDSGYLLDKNFRDWLAKQYLNSNLERRDPRVSPILCPKLKNSPPTIIVVAGLDPLKDESFAYIKKLKKHNVSTKLVFKENMIHCFTNYTGVLSEADDTLSYLTKYIKGKYFNRELLY